MSDGDKFFIVRGTSGFVRLWSHAVLHMYENDPNYEILGRDLSDDEALALARIANANIKQRIRGTE